MRVVQGSDMVSTPPPKKLLRSIEVCCRADTLVVAGAAQLHATPSRQAGGIERGTRSTHRKPSSFCSLSLPSLSTFMLVLALHSRSLSLTLDISCVLVVGCGGESIHWNLLRSVHRNTL